MIRLTLFLLSAALLLSGCNNPTYINVPNDGSDVAINDPNQLTVKTIQTNALKYLIAQSGIPGDIGVRFPEGTSERVALSIVSQLPKNVFVEGMTPGDEYQLIEVREISARSGRGRVDFIRPGSLQKREFVEVHLYWDFFDGWIVERLQVRNFEIDRVDPDLLVAPPRKPAQPKYEEVPAPVQEQEQPAE